MKPNSPEWSKVVRRVRKALKHCPARATPYFLEYFLRISKWLTQKCNFESGKGHKARQGLQGFKQIKNVKYTSFKVYGPESTRSFIQNYVFQLKENGLTYVN